MSQSEHQYQVAYHNLLCAVQDGTRDCETCEDGTTATHLAYDCERKEWFPVCAYCFGRMDKTHRVDC